MKIPMTLDTATVERALKNELSSQGVVPESGTVILVGFTRVKGRGGPHLVSAQIEVDTEPGEAQVRTTEKRQRPSASASAQA